MRGLGKGIRSFKDGVNDATEDAPKQESETKEEDKKWLRPFGTI